MKRKLEKIARDINGEYTLKRARNIAAKDSQRLISPQWAKLSEMLYNRMRNPSMGIKKYNNILDIGCGTGRFFPAFNCATLHALDLSEHMIYFAKEAYEKNNIQDILAIDEIEFIIADAIDFCSQEENTNKFDFIFSAGTFSVNMYSLDLYKLLSLLPRIGTSGAEYVIDINCKNAAHEIDKLNSVLNNMKKQGEIEDYMLHTGDNAIVKPVGEHPYTLLEMKK